MPSYTYKAQRQDGSVYDGKFEGEDRFALYGAIRKEGGRILTFEESSERRFTFTRVDLLVARVKLSEKIALTRNLAAMIEAGLSLTRALAVLERQTKNKKLKAVIEKISADIRGGSSFHEALKKHKKIFSPLFVSMVKAGEESGSLAGSLRVVGAQMEKAYQLTRKVRGALIYPAIVVTAMVGIGILMLIYVVPTLTSTFEELNAELPASTQAVIGVSEFLKNHTLTAIALFAGAVFGFFYLLRTAVGKSALEWLILRIPIISGIVRETNSARTTRTLSSLLSAGVDVILALSITTDVVQNSRFKKVLALAGEYVQKGSPLSKAFIENAALYPSLMSEMIAVGEETGKLSEMMLKTAEFYESEVEQKTKDMSTVIEPFLMIFIGIVVGFFAISMIMPIYSLSNSV